MSEEQEEQQPDQDGDAVELNFTVEFSEAEHEHYLAIRHANQKVMAAQNEYDRVSGIAKAAKKELELASLELSTLISDGPQIPKPPDPQKHFPFQDAESWKDVLVSDVLKLTDAQKEKLSSADITTMGRLEFVRAGRDPFFPNGLRSIKGFGEKTIDAIENDIVEWLAKNVREQESDE